MKVVITGGAGFIGSHTTDEFIKNGWKTTVIDSLETGEANNVNPSAKLIVHDISKESIIDVIDEEAPDVIVHLAAQSDVYQSIDNPVLDAKINIQGTVNLLEGSRRNKSKFVIASTAGVYGDIEKYPITETDPLSPKSFYALSKMAAEEYIKMYSHLYEIPYMILRYANVYGPRQKAKGEGGVVAVFLDRIKDNKDLSIHGDGSQTRDFIYVTDVAKANYMAAQFTTCETLHVSTGVRTKVMEIADSLISLTDSPPSIQYMLPRVGDVKDSCLDNSKIKEVLGWRPSVDLKYGLKETYESILSKI